MSQRYNKCGAWHNPSAYNRRWSGAREEYMQCLCSMYVCTVCVYHIDNHVPIKYVAD